MVGDDPAGVGFEEETENADHALASVIRGHTRQFELHLAGVVTSC